MPEPASAASPNSPPSAILLAFTGGLLDAFVYLNHGHVFASAMTGNGVLFGIALLTHDTTQAVRHIVPGIAFLAGIATSKLFESTLGSRAVAAGLLLELLTLFAASWLPAAFPQMAFTAIIAFVASYQVSSFRRVDAFAYNSTFITGNLRSVGDGVFEAISTTSDATARATGRRKFRDLSLVILGFLLGAMLGSFLAPRFGNHTLWFALPPLGIVLALSQGRLEAAGSSTVGSPS